MIAKATFTVQVAFTAYEYPTMQLPPVLVAVTAPPGWSSRSYPAELVNHVDPSGPVATAFTKVVRAIREAIGTDPLSEAMLKQIGAAAPPEDER